MAERLRIAWFSELNTGAVAGPSVAAYCSDQLLPLLRERFDIELFHNSFAAYRDYPTFHYLAAFRRDKERPFDLYFYQLEDRPASQYLRIQVGLQPGIIWFHDFIYRSFGPEPILNSPWRAVVAAFNKGVAADQPGEIEWPDRQAEYRPQGPYAWREAAYAAVALFPQQMAHADYQRLVTERLAYAGEPRSFLLPQPVDPQIKAGAGSFKIAFCGQTAIEYRAHKVLDALGDRPQWQLQWLLEDAELSRAEELCREFSVTNVTLCGGKSPARWQALLADCGAALHTKFSAYGVLGPYLGMSLMAGLPVIALNHGETELLPEAVLFKITPGVSESYQLGLLLDRLAELGPQPWPVGRDCARELFSCGRVAEQLALLFRTQAPFLGELQQQWAAVAAAARGRLMQETRERVAPAPTEWEQWFWQSTVLPTIAALGWDDPESRP